MEISLRTYVLNAALAFVPDLAVAWAPATETEWQGFFSGVIPMPVSAVSGVFPGVRVSLAQFSSRLDWCPRHRRAANAGGDCAPHLHSSSINVCSEGDETSVCRRLVVGH